MSQQGIVLGYSDAIALLKAFRCRIDKAQEGTDPAAEELSVLAHEAAPRDLCTKTGKTAEDKKVRETEAKPLLLLFVTA